MRRSPTATDLMVWGLVAHLIADWPLQNDWMANHKSDLRHPAGYVHAGIHGVALAPVFGGSAISLAAVHLLIDTRKPVAWWSRLVRQTQPRGETVVSWDNPHPVPAYDVGTEVRFWTDQVFHVATIAAVALLRAARH